MGENLTYRDAIRKMVPPWLSDRNPGPLTVGFRLLYGLAWPLDIMMQVAVEGLRAKYPGLGTPTALPEIGRDRKVLRGPNEGAASYAARLIGWLDAWRKAGAPPIVLAQLVPFFSPNAPPTMRIVTNHGVWYSLIPGLALAILRLNNWNWDNRPDLWARCWPIIYSDDSYPWDPEGAWGDGGTWGDGGVWGLTATRSEVRTLQQIVANWKSAHGLYVKIIVAFDKLSFRPVAPEPDGTWGKSYVLDGGVARPSRLRTARYLDGAA